MRDSTEYLALNLAMDRQILDIVDVSDLVRGQKRSRKQLWLSFDEWNVWHRARSGDAVNGHRTEAPHMLEEVYNLVDVLFVGGLINSLLRRSDRVRLASLAQLVNVIAPLMTNETSVLRQTIYYPYAWALEHASGATLSLSPEGPTYPVPHLGRLIEAGGGPMMGLGDVGYLDIAGTLDATYKAASLFILNRDLKKARHLEMVWDGIEPTKVTICAVMTCSNLKTTNTFDAPQRVTPQALKPPKTADRINLQVPARSYTALGVTMG